CGFASNLMIKVDRVSEPVNWSARADEATRELMAWQSDRVQRQAPYRLHLVKGVRPTLMRMFSGKCAYCESPGRTTGHAGIGQFRPKSLYWWLTYDWRNLLIACQVCNRQYKRDRFPLATGSPRAAGPNDDLSAEIPLLLDPCFDDPMEHLLFHED